jgi:hypothetical protein
MMRVEASVYDESGTKKVSPLRRMENALEYEEGRTCTVRTGVLHFNTAREPLAFASLNYAQEL